MKLVQTEKCGYGIAADEDINSGEFIIEYVGEVIDDEICEQRLWKLKHKVETNFYLCKLDNLVIDATYKGNKSRYFNHSCDPNTVLQKCCDTKKYSRFDQFGSDQDCHCGAVCCKKKLGAKASKTKNIPMDEDVNLTACKPPKVTYEDGVTEKIDMSREVWKFITV
ncbi:SET domain-containing protein [Hirschfeldia incana]|nr:SET domain-containing protein [Hirschfeldia incana]